MGRSVPTPSPERDFGLRQGMFHDRGDGTIPAGAALAANLTAFAQDSPKA